MDIKHNDVSLVGILGSDMHLYPEMCSDKESYGIFIIILGTITSTGCQSYSNDGGLIVPIHVWSWELVDSLKNRIKKGRPASIHGQIDMFGERLLVSINQESDITFRHPLFPQEMAAAQHDNRSREQLALACLEEDRFMLMLETEEKRRTAWICEEWD